MDKFAMHTISKINYPHIHWSLQERAEGFQQVITIQAKFMQCAKAYLGKRGRVPNRTS